MEEYLTRLLISAAPVLIFVFFLLLYMGLVRKWNRPFTGAQAQTPAYRKELQDEQKRIADPVDRIPTALESKKDAGKQRPPSAS